MKKYCLLIFFAYLFVFSCKETPNTKANVDSTELPSTDNKSITTKTKSSLDFLIAKYGRQETYDALFFIDKQVAKIFGAKADSLTDYYCKNGEGLKAKLAPERQEVGDVDSYLNNLSVEARTEIFQKIELWLKNNILLSSVLGGNLSDEVFFEELIYEIKDTKKLVTAYIKSPDQYWGSLDLNQSCKLSFDVNLYLLNLDSTHRSLFFREYFQKAVDQSLKKK